MLEHNRLPFQNETGPANAVAATEVEKLIKAAKDDQYCHPDAALNSDCLLISISPSTAA